jgi:hypothetical protein
MPKVPRSMKFDKHLWDAATRAAKQERRSTTAYIEMAVQEKLERDKLKK